MTVSSKNHQGRNRNKGGVKGMERKSNVNYARLIPRGKNDLIDELEITF